MFRVNHIHLKAVDPKVTAQWYVDMFGAKFLGEGPGFQDSRTVRLDLDGTSVTVTSAPGGQALPEGTAESHYGLEHFGLDTDDIEGTMAQVLSNGAEVLLPVTEMPSGAKISFIKGPDNVRIELVEPAA